MLKTSNDSTLYLRSSSGLDLRVHVHAGVADIPQPEWTTLFPGDPESWAFYRAGDEAAHEQVLRSLLKE